MEIIKNKGVAWNFLGSIANASTSAVLLLAVTRLCGAEVAGIFSIAFVTAQMLMAVGNYGVRAYQVSDVYEKVQFKEYEAHRIVTCIAMMIGVICFIFIRGYSQPVACIILLMGIYKMIDSYADVYEGFLQQKNYLELAGKSLFYRTFMSIVAFIICLYLKRNIILASAIAIAISCILLFLLAIRPVYVRSPKGRKICWKNLRIIFTDCFPLFCSLILLSVIVNIPKYSIEEHMSYEEQTYYNIIYLPAQIIYLLASIIFKPLLTMLTDIFHDNPARFKKYVLQFIGIIVVIVSAVVLGANFIGIPCLELLYGVELFHHKNALLCILVGGGCNAVSSFLYYMLAIMRRQLASMLSYVTGLICTWGVVGMLVRMYGIMGAALAYLSGMFTIMMIMIISLCCFRETKSQ